MSKLDKILEKIEGEGDFKTFTYKGYKCVIKRNVEVGGHLCGYVGVPKDHKLYKKSYDEVENSYEFIVHGGLTFSDFWKGREMKDDLWYIGFDCSHHNDLMPTMRGVDSRLLEEMTSVIEGSGFGLEYRDMEFVEREIQRLVDQIVVG